MGEAGRRKAKVPAETTCAECGTRLVKAISGWRCPRFSACGRGGLEETGAKLRARAAKAFPARGRDTVGAF